MRKRGYNIVLAALFFTILAVVPAIAFSKENNKIPARAPDTNGAYSTASVEKLNGNKNNLNVSVFAGGMVFSEKFSINNNSAGTFAVGEYLVYVATYGNTKIEHCFIVSVPLSVAEHKCSFVEVGRAEPTCVADGVIAYECDCGETYKEYCPQRGMTLSRLTQQRQPAPNRARLSANVPSAAKSRWRKSASLWGIGLSRA